MKNKDIKMKLIEILNELFPNLELNFEVIEYVDLIDDLGMDSITFISLVIEVEDAFGILVPDSMLILDNFRNVENILDFVENEMNMSDRLEK